MIGDTPVEDEHVYKQVASINRSEQVAINKRMQLVCSGIMQPKCSGSTCTNEDNSNSPELPMNCLTNHLKVLTFLIQYLYHTFH